MIGVMERGEGVPDGTGVAILKMVASKGFTDKTAFEAGEGQVQRCLEEKRCWQKEGQVRDT